MNMKIDASTMTIKQLVENKKSLIAAKKQLPIYSDPLDFTAEANFKPASIIKASDGDNNDPNKLKVSVIGNTCLWCDSHMDVLAVGAFDNTIKQKGINIPHLKDHRHDLSAKLGKTLKVYTDMVDVSDFGVQSDVKQTQVLMMDSELIRKWDEKIFEMYKDGGVNQHSIGLQYVRLELAVNDPDYKEEYDVWLKHIAEVINKDKVMDAGYFWWVTEVKVFEISAVLFASNELTPTTATENKENAAPSKDTQQEDKSDAVDDTSDIDQQKRNSKLLNC